MTVRTIDTSLNRTLSLNTWCCDLAGILNQFIRFFFTNGKVDFLYPSFIGISQRVLWQGICFRWIVRYHAWFSCADFDNLRYWSQGFFIRQLLTINNLTVRTVDTSLNRALSLNTWCCDLTSISNKLICILLFDIKVYFLYARFICICQWILWQSICFRCFIWHHAWFSRANFDNLCYRSHGFFIR